MREPPFRIGQPVLCVDASAPASPPLRLWGIYHVASLRWFDASNCAAGYVGWGLTVDELPPVETDEYFAEYRASRFRSIDPDSVVPVDIDEEVVA